MKAGPGRPKGSENKLTKSVKEMILAALDEVGGSTYLQTQANANPTAFLTLVGKVLPLQVTGPNDGPLKAELTVIERRIVRSGDPDR